MYLLNFKVQPKDSVAREAVGEDLSAWRMGAVRQKERGDHSKWSTTELGVKLGFRACRRERRVKV